MGPNKFLTHLLQQFDTLDQQLLIGPTSDVWKLDVIRELDELVHSHDDVVALSSYLRVPHRMDHQQHFDLHVARIQEVFYQVGLVLPGQNSSMLASADCHPFGTLDSSPLTPNVTFTPPRLNLEVGILHSAITMTILASLVDLLFHCQDQCIIDNLPDPVIHHLFTQIQEQSTRPRIHVTDCSAPHLKFELHLDEEALLRNITINVPSYEVNEVPLPVLPGSKLPGILFQLNVKVNFRPNLWRGREDDLQVRTPGSNVTNFYIRTSPNFVVSSLAPTGFATVLGELTSTINRPLNTHSRFTSISAFQTHLTMINKRHGFCASCEDTDCVRRFCSCLAFGEGVTPGFSPYCFRLTSLASPTGVVSDPNIYYINADKAVNPAAHLRSPANQPLLPQLFVTPYMFKLINLVPLFIPADLHAQQVYDAYTAQSYASDSIPLLQKNCQWRGRDYGHQSS